MKAQSWIVNYILFIDEKGRQKFKPGETHRCSDSIMVNKEKMEKVL